MINKFIESGCEFGRHAVAAAKASNQVGAISAKLTKETLHFSNHP